jgi:hypothetical protein
MTVFDEASTEQTQTPEATTTPDQTTTEETTTSPYLSKIIQERGDNWKDPEVLAKGKLEADQHIKSLETQLAELREDLSKQDYASQLLKQLQDKAPESTEGNPEVSTDTSGGTEVNTRPSVSEEELASLVEKTLTERERKASVQQNVDTVDKALTEKYGTEANAIVTKKAEELGLSLSRMEEIASESPTAFMALVGEPAPKAPVFTEGSVRTEAVGQTSGGQRDWTYYQNLRRKDRTLYFSPKIQQQMMEDKQKLGDRFGNV